MVQINLPKNSEVTKGKYYQDKTGSKNLRKVNVYRCQECWDSVPQENFTVTKLDDEGNKDGTRTVDEITLVRGHNLQDIIGWNF